MTWKKQVITAQPVAGYQVGGRAGYLQVPQPRILFISITPDSKPSGTPCLDKVSDFLEENGWYVGRFLGKGAVPSRLAGRMSVSALLSGQATYFAFVKELVKSIPRYNIVHLFFLPGMHFFRHIAPALVLGRFLGKRVVLSYHRNQAEEELEKSGWWLFPFFQLCDRVVVSSEYIAGLLAHSRVRSEVIHSVVDSHLFRSRHVCSVQPRIIVARSLERRCNIACSIEAFKLVKQKYPRTEMVIAGDGSRREELESVIARENLNSVTFTGWVSPRQLAQLFEKADVYVNTSSIDGLPTSLLEALAMGLPVVTTGAGGIPAVVADRENGLLVKFNDPVEVADRIIELVESPELVQKLSEQARLSVKGFSWHRMRRKWFDLYQDLS